ncbi:MAG: hypothetical protein [Cressdnaviricota sp.]|nr:MAG: hypothetical protein [Cressdnaviricota sp.]
MILDINKKCVRGYASEVWGNTRKINFSPTLSTGHRLSAGPTIGHSTGHRLSAGPTIRGTLDRPLRGPCGLRYLRCYNRGFIR